MRTLATTALVLTALTAPTGLTASPAFAQAWATRMFEKTTHDFGSVARNSKTEYEFKLKNLFKENVHIASVRSSCGCTSPRIEKNWLKSHEQGAIIAKINTDTFRGSKGATLTVTIDRPFPARVQLHVKVNIRDDLLLTPASVQFGSVQRGAAAERSLEVSFTKRDDWRILGVNSANAHLSGEVVTVRRDRGRVSYQLRIRLDADTPAGYLQDHLMLVTNDRGRTEIPIRVDAHVTLALSVSPATLSMGVVRPGETVRRQLVVRSTKPFRIKQITADGHRFLFDKLADGAPKSLHVIPVTFVAGSTPGRVDRTIRIETDLDDTATELHASAVVSSL